MNPETRLNGLHFCCDKNVDFRPIYAYLNSAWRGKLQNLTEVANHCYAKKTSYVGSRSFKVIELDTNQAGISNFLFVINSTSAVSRTVSELRRLIGQKSPLGLAHLI